MKIMAGEWGVVYDDKGKVINRFPIVRCKDCYCFGEPTYIKGYHVCSFYKTHIQENDYCSKGIRYIKCDADK